MMFWTEARMVTGVVMAAVVLAGTGVRVTAAQGTDPQPGLREPIEIHKGLSDTEWPQAQNTPQRTGYSPMRFDLPPRLKWEVSLSDDHGPQYTPYTDIFIGTAVQVIVGDGRVYVGAQKGDRAGIMFALDALTGEEQWRCEVGGPIYHTAGYAEGKVFFGALDGCVYALNAATGKKDWVFDNRRRHGFSNAVLLADDRVFIADRGGRMFALNQKDGTEAWHYDVGVPAYQSAAYNAGRVYFAGEDMRVHALKAGDGTRVWRSEKLAGLSFRYCWPVVVHGKVIVCSMNQVPVYGDREYAFEGAWKDPARRCMFILDEETGKECPPIEHYGMGHSGTLTPPAVTGDGLLVVPWPGGCFSPWKEYLKALVEEHGPRRGWGESIRKQGFSWEYRHLGFALQDMRTGRMLRLLEDTGEIPASWKSPSALYQGKYYCPNTTDCDQTIMGSVIGNKVMAFYRGGWWAQHWPLGAYDLTRGAYASLGWRYRSGDRHTTGGGGSGVSAANGLIYNVSSCRYVQCYESASQ